MLDCLSGGRVDRRHRLRHADGQRVLLRHPARRAARPLLRGARADPAGVGGRGAVRVQRQVHQAALRQPVAAPDPGRSADLDPRLGQPRDLGPGQRPSTTATATCRSPASRAPTPIVNGFWDYTEQHGGNMNPHRMAFTQVICCADTDEEAESAVLRRGASTSTGRTRSAVEFATPPGYLTQASTREALQRGRRSSRRRSGARPPGAS